MLDHLWRPLGAGSSGKPARLGATPSSTGVTVTAKELAADGLPAGHQDVAAQAADDLSVLQAPGGVNLPGALAHLGRSDLQAQADRHRLHRRLIHRRSAQRLRERHKAALKQAQEEVASLQAQLGHLRGAEQKAAVAIRQLQEEILLWNDQTLAVTQQLSCGAWQQQLRCSQGVLPHSQAFKSTVSVPAAVFSGCRAAPRVRAGLCGALRSSAREQRQPQGPITAPPDTPLGLPCAAGELLDDGLPWADALPFLL